MAELSMSRLRLTDSSTNAEAGNISILDNVPARKSAAARDVMNSRRADAVPPAIPPASTQSKCFLKLNDVLREIAARIVPRSPFGKSEMCVSAQHDAAHCDHDHG